MDQEEVALKFETYGFMTMPVVDENNKILGIVTVDDIVEVMQEETTEDIHRLGGVDEEEKVDGSLRDSIKSRSVSYTHLDVYKRQSWNRSI